MRKIRTNNTAVFATMKGYCEAARELLKVKNFIISGKHTYGVFSNKEEAVVFLES